MHPTVLMPALQRPFWMMVDVIAGIDQKLEQRPHSESRVRMFREGRGVFVPALLSMTTPPVDSSALTHWVVRHEFDRTMGKPGYGFMGWGRYGLKLNGNYSNRAGYRNREITAYLKSLCVVTSEDYGTHLRGRYPDLKER